MVEIEQTQRQVKPQAEKVLQDLREGVQAAAREAGNTQKRRSCEQKAFAGNLKKRKLKLMQPYHPDANAKKGAGEVELRLRWNSLLC